MNDFERELTRLMHDARQPAPFRPEHRRRLYEGIRVRRRTRTLWRAGGSALAVAGLSVALAVLPGTDSRSAPPADQRPRPATSPTPPASPAPTDSGPTPLPSTSAPPTSTPEATFADGTAPGHDTATSSLPPAGTPTSTRRPTTAPPPDSSPTPTPPPSTPPARGRSAPAGEDTAGSG
ncbi:cellulase [Streptomyces fungicidicus]|uniref:cellulase n=1 Tax=Streptomyces fungicidicus TaxID=68203 RepID=UPI00378AB404